MHFSRAAWVRLSLILLASLVTQLAQFDATSAQDAPSIVVEDSRAESDFPEGMEFELSASVEDDVKRVDLVYQQASLGTLNLLPAEFEQSGDRLDAEASAELEINFVPVGIDLTYRWVVTFSDDSIAETESEAVTWIDDRFEWDRLEGEGVEIYWYDRSGEFADYVLEVAAESLAGLTDLYEPEHVSPIRIWLYESREDFAGTFASNSETWAAGAAYPSLQVILAVIPDDSESEVLRVIPHEISHQVLYQATRNPFNAPATWIDEGLAVLAQTGGAEQYRDLVADAFEEGDLLSLASLNSSFPFTRSDATLAYGQSFLVMEYLRMAYGDEAIQRIIEAYAEGASHDRAIEDSLGVTIEQLQRDWESTLRNSIRVSA
jgi:hypothetical protein